MTNIQIFQSPEFGQITTAVINGKEHFAATECAQALGYERPHDAISRHCPHSVKHGVGVETGKKADGTPAIQTIEKTFIPEGDLYRLIVRSHLPSAERFERWVFDEVLPTIRKHGVYISDVALHRLHEKIDRLEDENYQLQQRVKGLGSGHGSFQLWDVAQQLRKNGIGDGNVHKTLQMMIEQRQHASHTGYTAEGFPADLSAAHTCPTFTGRGQIN